VEARRDKGRQVSDDATYPDLWSPGGKFVESGLYEVEESIDPEPGEDAERDHA
jgi:hypothetical protein